jgi:RHS repeat-associated protein
LHALGCDWLEFGADLRVGLSRAYNGAYGYEYIPFTGLYHVGAREYDPRTARWLQRDPIDVAGGHPSVCLYCGNDPANYADPMGTSPLFLATAAVTLLE